MQGEKNMKPHQSEQLESIPTLCIFQRCGHKRHYPDKISRDGERQSVLFEEED